MSNCFSLFVVSPALSPDSMGTADSSRFTIDLPYQLSFDTSRLTDPWTKFECALINGGISASWFNVRDAEFKLGVGLEGSDGEWENREIPAGYYCSDLKEFWEALETASGDLVKVTSVDEYQVTIDVAEGAGIICGEELSNMFVEKPYSLSDSRTLTVNKYWEFRWIFVEGPGWINGSVVNEFERPIIAAAEGPFVSSGEEGEYVSMDQKRTIWRAIEIPETKRLTFEIKDEKGRPLRFLRRSCFLHFLFRKKMIN